MSLKTKPARQIPNRNVRLNQFYEFVTNPTLRYRLARHGLMWGVSLFIIYKRFEYNAVLLSSLAERELYINLSTLFFGGLTILDYVLITLLLRELVLRRSQMKLFVLGLIGVHVLTALLVRWNIHWFVDLFNKRHLPVAYRTFAEHVTNLSLWKTAFDPVIVGVFCFSHVYSYLLLVLMPKMFKDLFLLRVRQTGLENAQLQLEKDNLQLGNDKLQLEKDNLQLGNDKLQLEKDNLQLGNDKLQLEKDNLQLGNDKLQLEKDNLHNDKLQLEKDNLHNDKLQLEKDNLQLGNDKLQLEKDNLKLEYQYLKAQVNPHFLFNTLNNLYGLSRRFSEKTPETIAKLSELMRYTLYSTEREFVPLAEEIRFLENYLSLQRLREEAHAALAFQVQGSTDGLSIAPLLLLVFVENAFKHGTQASPAKTVVHICLAIDQGTLTLDVANNVPDGTPRPNPDGGIGHRNVKRRLDLFYPGQHDLSIDHRDGQYLVKLKINLHGHAKAIPGDHRG